MNRFFVLALALLFSADVYGVTLKVSWDPRSNENIISYRVHWGFSSGLYSHHADAGNTTFYEIENVQAGANYYCAVTSVDQWGLESVYSTEVSARISDDPGSPELPLQWELQAGYPNPFRQGQVSTVRLAVPEPADFTLTVYNVLGQKVRTLHSGAKSAGQYFFYWDGRDDGRHILPSASYFYYLQYGREYLMKSISLIH
jgi:hypothetical protein